ncbi:MAG: ASKHA domain-containing protein [Dehalococcoidia bacterium]
MTEHSVVFQPSGNRGNIQEGKTIMEAARELGVGLQSICGGHQTCGKCKVKIQDHHTYYETGKKDQQRVSPPTDKETELLGEDAISEGYRLACATHVLGDLTIDVPPETRVSQETISKTATQKAVTLKTAVRKLYLEVPEPKLGDSQGDWERVAGELEGRFGLTDLTADYEALSTLPKALRDGNWKVTVTLFIEKRVIKVEPGLVETAFGVALDVGTTTLAGYLCDLATGEIVATEARSNPQISYGEDVISRITHTVHSKKGLKELRSCLFDSLNDLVKELCNQANITRKDIIDATIVGNTAMHHIFLNLDPQHLASSPFTPVLQGPMDMNARDFGLAICPGANVHTLPVEAGFVGADNVAVVIAEEPYNQDEMMLVIDVGTNGELVLGNRERLLSASCATGPAFEGAHIKFGMRAARGAIESIKIDPETYEVRFKVVGDDRWNDQDPQVKATGICGSAIIDATAEMLRAGIINPRGAFHKNISNSRMLYNKKEAEFVIAWADETDLGHDITVCQNDIRSMQLGKGALLSGANLLMRQMGIESVDKVILAGSFGLHIDRQNALDMGLFPEVDAEAVYSTGNAAGEGARLALLNTDKRKEAADIARRIEYMELSLESDFQKEFVQAMIFPTPQEAKPG